MPYTKHNDRTAPSSHFSGGYGEFMPADYSAKRDMLDSLWVFPLMAVFVIGLACIF